MSDAPPVYDVVELRRRIVVCFTPGELRELAEQLGVSGSIQWERGAQEAARELVKQCERYAGLPALVAKLREVRPLVEWPEAAASEAPAAQAFPEAPPLAPLPAAMPPAGAPAPAAPAPSPALASAPAAPSPTIADPFAASPAAAPAPAPVAPAHSAAPSPPIAASPVWPGLAAAPPQQQQPRGLDPRILVAVAGLMLLAAIVAYLAGRAANPAPTSAASPAESAAPRRTEGPAALAADTVARRLAALARICELPPGSFGSSDGELVFRRVFERCGPAPPPPQRPYQPSRDPTREPPPEPSAAADDAPPDRGPQRPRRPARGDAPAGEAAPQPTKGCTGACDAQHQACKTRCGPEPTESGAYDGYQRCLGRCLTDASHCRLACH